MKANEVAFRGIQGGRESRASTGKCLIVCGNPPMLILNSLLNTRKKIHDVSRVTNIKYKSHRYLGNASITGKCMPQNTVMSCPI